ncbi:hypothetical protein [Virgibacillus sp. Bac332]|uniref:hypothetical protein n=1 Tax=Virgibacillus sp. Bac332 TaxID=2419842 RepID=UPI000EF4A825|nr:hypothetical protein [Virgibacillus sp. Bac332]
MIKNNSMNDLSIDIMFKEQSKEERALTEDVIKACLKSGLSYKDMNKALYLADKGLYRNTINKPRIKDKVFDGKKTLNEMRVEQGLDKVDDPAFDSLLKQMD